MIKIGIFIKKHDSLFTNGCIQQGFFVMKSLRNAGYIVNYITVEDNYTRFEAFDEYIENVKDIDKLKEYNIVIFSSLSINQVEFLSYLKLLGIKIINQLVGNYYYINAEEFVFGHHNGIMKNMLNEYVDEVWLMPMYKHCIQYIQSITKKNVKICPYVWDNSLMNLYIQDNKIVPFYNLDILKDQSKKLDILILEPNISIHKNSLVPLLISNQFFINNPSSLGNIYLISEPIYNNNYLDCITHLEIVQQNKIKTYPRIISFNLYHELRKNGSKFVVLSNCNRNGLNFLHLECFELGIPIIHNCPDFKSNSLYYEDSDNFVDIQSAVSFLENISQPNWISYSNNHIQNIINKYDPLNTSNVNNYKNLILSINSTKKFNINDITSLFTNINQSSTKYNLNNTNSIGIVSYINKDTCQDILLKSLKCINSYLNQPIQIHIYKTRDCPLNNIEIIKSISNIPSSHNISIEFINTYEESNIYFSYYALSNSIFDTTIYFENNTVLYFNAIELTNKLIKNHNNEFITIPRLSIHKSVEIYIFFKLLNIPNQKPIYNIDQSFIIYNSYLLKKIYNEIYIHRHIISQLIPRCIIQQFACILSNIKLINLNATKSLIGKFKDNLYSNHGYINVLSNVVLNSIYDEKKDLDINSIPQFIDKLYEYEHNDGTIVRNINVNNVNSISL